MIHGSGWRSRGKPLTRGAARGEALVLVEALSFWGGVDPATGIIIDRRHPQVGQSVTDRVLVLATGRGSSSSSTVLAECVRRGTAPCALILGEIDPILVVGALVAAELYGHVLPVIAIEGPALDRIRTGDGIRLLGEGTILVEPGGPAPP